MMFQLAGRFLLLVTAGVLAAGCASYRVGAVNPTIPADNSIQVGLFQNTTAQPGLSESVNASIRRELHSDGTFELATARDGDVLLTGNITSYRRSAVSFQPKDILSVRDFVVELSTQVKATERTSGKVLVDRIVTSRTTVRLGDDLASTERQALPLLANDLAKRTVAMLAEGEW